MFLIARKTAALGPAFIVLATCLMALQDVMVKMFSDALPLWQLFFLRSALVIPIILGLLYKFHVPWAAAFGLMVSLRSLLIVGMYVAFYAAMPKLELPIIAACYYTAPLIITLLSCLVLRERLSSLQVGLMALAFVGVLVVLRPDRYSLSPYVLIPFAAALCYALAAIVTRSRISDTSPLAILLSLNVAFVLVGAIGMAVCFALDAAEQSPFLLTPWRPLKLDALGTTVALGLMSLAIHALLAKAYQLGPTAVVAGLDFSYLAFTSLWSFLLLSLKPDASVLAGTALIAVAGLLSVLRSQRASPKPCQRASL